LRAVTGIRRAVTAAAQCQRDSGRVSGHDIAVTPDGKGFILIRESDMQTGPREMQVVVNWLEELKQRPLAELMACFL
jgi:hypothetical protein